MRIVAPLLLCAAATMAGHAQTWRTLDVSRQLRDSTEHRVRVRYGDGKFSLKPTAEPVLYTMQLRYDEDRSHPLYSYDAENRSATLGVEGTSQRWTQRLSERNAGEMKLGLSPAVPMELDLELGATEARVDVGGLSISNLRIETGVADAVLDFSAPNRVQMRRLDVKLGATGFVVTHLANANVSTIKVTGGVGSVDLDFGGALKQDVSVGANVAFGKLTVHLPSDIGVRVHVNRVLGSFDREGFTKRGNAYYSDNWDTAKFRMRLQAETVFGAIGIERDR